MAKETVLLYNCGGDEFKTLRALLMMLRVRVRMVEPSRYHLPLEQVAAGKGEEDPKQQADIPEAMMVAPCQVICENFSNLFFKGCSCRPRTPPPPCGN